MQYNNDVSNTSAHIPAVLSLGIVSQIAQIVLLRELLMVFHGSELSLGIILAAWMLWVGIGSRIGAGLAGRFAGRLGPVALIAAVLMVLAVLTVAAIRLLRGAFAIAAGAWFSTGEMLLACLLVQAPVGLLLGTQFVLLAGLWRTNDAAADTSGAEKTYIGEAAGNIIGGLFFSLVLVHVFNAFATMLLATGILTAAMLWLGARRRKAADGRSTLYLTRAPKLLCVLLLLLATASFLFLDAFDLWLYRLQWQYFSPAYHLVDVQQSRYGAIAVVARDNQYSFFQSGNLVFSTAGPDALEPAFEEQEAVVMAHFAMVQHPRPERILLIGGGLRGTLREIARHPVSHIDAVELDPQLTAAALPWLPQATLNALDDARVRLIHTDGRRFIKTTQSTYDLILVDIPDPATAVLNRYYTVEFFREVNARLNPGGVFVTGVTSTADMRGEAVAHRNTTVYHTLKQVFDAVLPAGSRHLFFSAGNTPDQISADAGILAARYLERNVQAEGFSARQFELLLEEAPLRRLNWILRNHGRSPDAHLKTPPRGPLFPASIEEQALQEANLPAVQARFFLNSDFKPIGYYYTLRFWDALSGGRQANTFRSILHVRPWWSLFAVLFCFGFVLFLKQVPALRKSSADRHFAVRLAVFTTGLATMALQVALILAFQSLYGFVYEMIGVITGLFMAGLALGTFTIRKLVKVKSNYYLLAVIQLITGLYALFMAFVLPEAATLAQPNLVFGLTAALTFGAGFINGADFPLAAACCQALRQNPEQSTGTVYGVELLGACAGALMASVVVAPVLGIPAVCLLAAIANLTAFGVLRLSGQGIRGEE